MSSIQATLVWKDGEKYHSDVLLYHFVLINGMVTIIKQIKKVMDNMYLTVQAARRAAIKAHIAEKQCHIIFKEAGLFRINPIDEIEEIDQRAIFGWTYQMGDVAKVRKQFYKNDCYYNPERIGLKLRNKYSSKEIYEIIMTGQKL